MEASTQNFFVHKDEKGQRLDQFLQKQVPDLSRAQIKKLIEQKQVQITPGSLKPAYLLKGGEEISLTIPPPEKLEVQPEALPLNIIYEDSDLIVLNKSAERIVHPGAGVKEGTLVHALLHHCQDLSGIGGVLRPGIVHRLDKGTSGVLVVAKNDLAHQVLAAQFKERQIKKIYHALIWGKPKRERGRIEKPLGRDPKDRKKMSSRAKQTREAITEYRMLKNYGPISLMELKPQTGRTHQLRVHLSELGHPVVGDPIYGKGLRKLASLPEGLREKIKALPFQLLHASELSFEHPRTHQLLHFKAPLREEMKQIEEELKNL